jgi:hypothetical protein
LEPTYLGKTKVLETEVPEENLGQNNLEKQFETEIKEPEEDFFH